jgi:cohesin complex subunit SCC1
LPADQFHAVNPITLTLPDTITELDLFGTMMDPDLLLAEPMTLGSDAQDNNLLDWGTQSLITDSIDQPRSTSAPKPLDDHGLILDLGDDESIEIGRRAPEPLENFPDEPTLLQDDGLLLDLGDDLEPPRETSVLPRTELEDIPMDDIGVGGFDTTLDLGTDLGADIAPAAPTPGRKDRDTFSPLSDIRPSVERELEASIRPNEPSMYEPQDVQDDTIVEAAQRIKRRKVLQLDSELELANTQIRAQQNDRSKILKPASFLPRDPMLLALMNMQKNGGFISSILGDGRSLGWAPELRGVLSVEVVRRSGELKRKRDSGVADMYSDEDQQSPKDASRLELEEEGPSAVGGQDLGADFDDVGRLEEIPSDGPARGPSMDADDDLGPGSPLPLDNFDDTTMPILHPADAGPISQGTRHAVHLLREEFGPEGADSESHRQKNSVLLQDLLPEKTTSKRDATKMFFEVLVLATKDAVKVEQDDIGKGIIGGPIRIRAKRGLYGAWAEETTGSVLESQTQPEVVAA